METSLLSKLSFISGDRVSVLLNEEYYQELGLYERTYDYSHLCFQDGSSLSTFGFSKIAISQLVSEVNSIKFQSSQRIHIFDVNLEFGQYADESELPAIPYIDLDKAREEDLSNLSKQLIDFINSLDKETLQGILISFFRESNDGTNVINYASHVSPILLVPEEDSFVVVIFDGTAFELMGRQGEYKVVQIPTLRKSASNCFAYSFTILKKCISHPEIVQDFLYKRGDISGSLTQPSLYDLPPDLIQYLESVSTKTEYIQQIRSCAKKIFKSPVTKILIKTLKKDGSTFTKETIISCKLYNKTYKYAMKLLSSSDSDLLLYIQEEQKKFHEKQCLLSDFLVENR